MRGMILRGDGGDGHLITALYENFSGEIGLTTIDGLNLRKTPLAKQFAGGSYAKFWLSIQ